MENPFKFGTIVEGDYFTDRTKEISEIRVAMSGPNHLILISPRRFGKSSLVSMAIKGLGRPSIMINMLQVTSTEDFASSLLRELFKLYPWQKIKHKLTHFRIVPTISTNPLTGGMDVSFNPTADSSVLLEDAMALVEKVGSPEKRIIVILDEFQGVLNIRKGLEQQLRAIMQKQNNINYIFLGSQESMMEGIFERKKSPFYHFGSLMRIGAIPYKDFHEYLAERLSPVIPVGHDCEQTATEILEVTNCHPYYTQQLAAKVWEILALGSDKSGSLVDLAISSIINVHDLDYERLWETFNRTDKKVMQLLSIGKDPRQGRIFSPSTLASSIKRLTASGYLINEKVTKIEDPFFSRWLAQKQQ